MKDSPPGRSAFERCLAPRALLLGVVVGFVVCCAAGWAASRRNHFHRFERFHLRISPQTHFYPTACQVRQLARSRLDSGKIVVVVGGSSRLQGFGQSVERLWTRRLQALLGEQFQVINLGLCGAATAEFGGTAAEMLARDYPKLLLVSDLTPDGLWPDPDGNTFKYFFWDARCKGLLPPCPERDNRLREEADELEAVEPVGQQANPLPRRKGERLDELRTEMRLDSALFFNDLWNTLAYTRFCTMWTPLTDGSATRARRHYADAAADGVPGGGPILRDHDRLRHHLSAFVDPRSPEWARFDRSAATAFPEVARKRTLLLVMWNSPAYLDKLSAEDQARYAKVSRLSVEHLEKQGFAALEIGKDCAPTDYADFCHLAVPGGERLAETVAARLRDMAQRLGYVAKPEREAP